MNSRKECALFASRRRYHLSTGIGVGLLGFTAINAFWPIFQENKVFRAIEIYAPAVVGILAIAYGQINRVMHNKLKGS